MRGLHLFALVIGVLPVSAFGTTVWLTSGAPFEPFDSKAGSQPEALTERGHDGAKLPVNMPGIGAGATETSHENRAEDTESDRDRLIRLARDGDTAAAILLTILEEPRGLTAQQAGRAPPTP